MTANCRRCGDTTTASCEDWDCHLGWGELCEPPNATGGYVSFEATPALRDEYVIRTEDLPPGWSA